MESNYNELDFNHEVLLLKMGIFNAPSRDFCFFIARFKPEEERYKGVGVNIEQWIEYYEALDNGYHKKAHQILVRNIADLKN